MVINFNLFYLFKLTKRIMFHSTFWHISPNYKPAPWHKRADSGGLHVVDLHGNVLVKNIHG